jgi:hypothetical protein
MNDYLNRECKQVGSGQKLVNWCGGLAMERGDYAKQLWKLASVYLSKREYPKRRQRKVWREGLEVAIKVKGSQGKRRVEWVKPEHPWSAIRATLEVRANHTEAFNSSICRRCSAYRRRQNHYDKTSKGLQHMVTFERLIHNWVRPHWSLDKNTTPAMAIGFTPRPIKMAELLNLRGFQTLTKLADQCQKFTEMEE